MPDIPQVFFGRFGSNSTRSRKPLKNTSHLDLVHDGFAIEHISPVFRREDEEGGVRLIGNNADVLSSSDVRDLWHDQIHLAHVRRGLIPSPDKVLAMPDLSRVYEIVLPPGTDALAFCEAYSGSPHVEWCQENIDMQAHSVPNDPYLRSVGSFGQPFADLWGHHKIHAPKAWPESDGRDVVVAVVDTGLDYNHPDIRENLWINPDVVTDLNSDGQLTFADVDLNGDGKLSYTEILPESIGWDFSDYEDKDPMDKRGHGTHVAGTIAARGGNGIGIAGIAHQARIMPLKGFPDQGSASNTDLAAAILWGATHGAHVINNSWGCKTACPINWTVEEAVLAAHELGAVVVFSAGNKATDTALYSPQNLDEPIVVAASTHEDTIADFSNYGDSVDVSAPGGESGFWSPDGCMNAGAASILSLRASGTDMFEGYSCYQSLGVAVPEGEASALYYRALGTSMAAPHVSGVAALVISYALRHDIAYSPESISDVLKASAVKIQHDENEVQAGAGRVDAFRALNKMAKKPAFIKKFGVSNLPNSN